MNMEEKLGQRLEHHRASFLTTGCIHPTIMKNMDGREEVMDLYNYYFRKRVVFINSLIDDGLALNVITQLNYLDNVSDEDITLVINSHGGSVSAGMMIYDMMKYGIRCDVKTVATGVTASMAAFLLAAGTPGKRSATQNAEIMIHQPLGGVQGQASDILLEAEHITAIKLKSAKLLAEMCGRPESEVLKDIDRNNWKSAKEAMDYGLIDSIIHSNAGQEV